MAEWISRGRLPAIIDKTLRVVPMIRMSPDGKRLAAVLLNARLDPTGPFDLRLRANVKKVSLVTPNGKKALPVRGSNEPQASPRGRCGEIVVRIPNIPPWQTAVIVSD